jgi:predicted  nucleic acid-binding Zn-ribbon protein
MTKNKKITIEGLAGMVKKGFDGMTENFSELRQDVGELKQKVGGLEQKVDRIEEDVGDIKLRMGNVAWNFETRELDKRVTKLERKAGKK